MMNFVGDFFWELLLHHKHAIRGHQLMSYGKKNIKAFKSAKVVKFEFSRRLWDRKIILNKIQMENAQ